MSKDTVIFLVDTQEKDKVANLARLYELLADVTVVFAHTHAQAEEIIRQSEIKKCLVFFYFTIDALPVDTDREQLIEGNIYHFELTPGIMYRAIKKLDVNTQLAFYGNHDGVLAKILEGQDVPKSDILFLEAYYPDQIFGR